MTSRERVLAAFAHQPTDRVPIFDQTVFSNVASAALGRDLDTGGGTIRYKEALSHLAGEQAHAEYVDKILRDVAYLSRTVGYDIIRMPWRETRRPSARLDDYTFLFGDRDDRWSVCRYSPQAGNWHEIDNHLRHEGPERLLADLRREVAAFRGAEPPDAAAFADWDRLRSYAGADLAGAIGAGGIGFGMHDPVWLEALCLDPDLLRAWHDQHCDRQIAWIEAYRARGGDVCLAGGDFCYHAGPAYSPELFRQVVLPGLKRIVTACNRLGMHYVFRTDGNTWTVADMLFVEAGCHGYGEIDYSAGMRLDEIRRAFPRVCLFGNVDCAGVLVSGSVDDVRRATQDNLCATGGLGHVLGSSNSIVYETPPANYLAMVETARAWRGCRETEGLRAED